MTLLAIQLATVLQSTMKPTATTKSKLAAIIRPPSIGNRDEATAVAAATVALMIERDRVQAKRNAIVEEASLAFAVELDELNAKISRNEKALLMWAIAHRAAEFGDAKTIGLAGHKLAFREGTGKVGFAEDVTEDDIITAIISDEALVERYLTIKPALDKNPILAALRAGGEAAAQLQKIGLRLVKEEKCKFEPDLDQAPASQAIAV
jgi:phage host-nuclease inhibitor protein Gam